MTRAHRFAAQLALLAHIDPSKAAHVQALLEYLADPAVSDADKHAKLDALLASTSSPPEDTAG